MSEHPWPPVQRLVPAQRGLEVDGIGTPAGRLPPGRTKEAPPETGEGHWVEGLLGVTEGKRRGRGGAGGNLSDAAVINENVVQGAGMALKSKLRSRTRCGAGHTFRKISWAVGAGTELASAAGCRSNWIAEELEERGGAQRPARRPLPDTRVPSPLVSPSLEDTLLEELP